jgi:hypothetical protein
LVIAIRHPLPLLQPVEMMRALFLNSRLYL